MALCEAGKRVAKSGSSIYRKPAMSLFGILKGALGIPHYAGIEGCRQEAEAGKAQAQFTLGGFTSAASLGCHRITLNPGSGIGKPPNKTITPRSFTWGCTSPKAKRWKRTWWRR